MSPFFKAASEVSQLYSTEFQLEAIWMERPVQTGTERTVRITHGHTIRVEDNGVVDCTPDKPATHKVIGCTGTVSSSVLNFILIDLKTNRPTILKVK